MPKVKHDHIRSQSADDGSDATAREKDTDGFLTTSRELASELMTTIKQLQG